MSFNIIYFTHLNSVEYHIHFWVQMYTVIYNSWLNPSWSKVIACPTYAFRDEEGTWTACMEQATPCDRLYWIHGQWDMLWFTTDH